MADKWDVVVVGAGKVGVELPGVRQADVRQARGDVADEGDAVLPEVADPRRGERRDRERDEQRPQTESPPPTWRRGRRVGERRGGHESWGG